VKININNHLQTLSKDIFISADYAFSSLEAIHFSFFRLIQELLSSQDFYGNRWLALTFDPVTFSMSSL